MQDAVFCEALRGDKRVRGRVRANQVIERPSRDLWLPATPWRDNLVVYEWGAIVGRLLTQGDIRYRIAGMYLEFYNTASRGDAVAIPALDRRRDIEYYDALAGSADYLRVSLRASQFLTSSATLYPKGNQPIFLARSMAGSQGVHGLEFSYAANSVVYGAALVAFTDNDDATQDLVFSAFYFPTEEQQPKLATSQLGLEWELTLQ